MGLAADLHDLTAAPAVAVSVASVMTVPVPAIVTVPVPRSAVLQYQHHYYFCKTMEWNREQDKKREEITIIFCLSRPPDLEHKDAHEVDEEAEDGDHQQPLVLHLRRLHQPLHRLQPRGKIFSERR